MTLTRTLAERQLLSQLNHYQAMLADVELDDARPEVASVVQSGNYLVQLMAREILAYRRGEVCDVVA